MAKHGETADCEPLQAAVVEQIRSVSFDPAPPGGDPPRLEPPADGEPPPVPGHRNYLIFSDETGTGGAIHYGFGTLWLPYERRGDLYRVVNVLRDAHGYVGEIKWNKVSRGNVRFYLALLDEFFKRPWLMFHALAVRKGYVDKGFHDGDFDLARRKHYEMLIAKKIAYFNDGHTDKAYHIRVDTFASRYGKAVEVIDKIACARLKGVTGLSPIRSFREVDSKQSLGIQMADFLLGASLASWQGEIESDHKRQVVAALAGYLGWPDMLADTFPREAKFNVWSFHNPQAGARERITRHVSLKYAMPVFKKR